MIVPSSMVCFIFALVMQVNITICDIFMCSTVIHYDSNFRYCIGQTADDERDILLRTCVRACVRVLNVMISIASTTFTHIFAVNNNCLNNLATKSHIL